MKSYFILTIVIMVWQGFTQNSYADGNLANTNFLIKDSADVSIEKSVRSIDNYYTDLYKRGKFNGNILIAYKGNVVYKKSMGYAVRETRIPLTTESTFQLASTSKPFTAAAILQLYEKGKLDLDDEVSKYYPGFPYKNVTIKNLLCHRSGLPDYLKCGSLLPKKTFLTNQDVMDMFINRKPRAYASPNAVFKYNNSNYAVLAALVEKISGEDFDKYCEENIFKPLGMKNTWVWHPEQANKKTQTNGYNSSWVLRKPDMFDGVHGDKGVYSTTEDMLKWDQSWNEHKLLKESTIAAAYEGQTKSTSGKDYGLGWRMQELEGDKKLIYHNGWWHEYNIVFKRFIDDSLTIIILSNKYNQSIYKTEFIETALLDGNKNMFDSNLNDYLYAKKEDSEDDEDDQQTLIELNPFNYLSPRKLTANNPTAKNIATPKTSTDNTQYYTVRKGDTLFNISQRFDVSVELLKKWNKMATANIRLGQKLLIEKLGGGE